MSKLRIGDSPPSTNVLNQSNSSGMYLDFAGFDDTDTNTNNQTQTAIATKLIKCENDDNENCNNKGEKGDDGMPNSKEEEMAISKLNGDEQCSIDFSVKTTLKDDLIREKAIGLFENLLCPRCGETFSDKAIWQKHLDNRHYFHNFKILPITLTADAKHYKCNKCDNIYTKTAYRDILHHCFTHMPYNFYFKCGICDQVALQKNELQQHLEAHFQEHLGNIKTIVSLDGFKKKSAPIIELCDKIQYEKYLRYICPVCQKHLEQEVQWQQHVEREHQLFNQHKLNFTLHANVDVNFGDIQYSPQTRLRCNTCNIILSNPEHQCQVKHYLTHFQHKSFSCNLCDMVFDYQMEIDWHVPLLHAEHLLPNNDEDVPLGENSTNDNIEFELHKKYFERGSDGMRYLDHVDFYCPICNSHFEAVTEWTEHINMNHDFFKPSHMALEFVGVNTKTVYCLSCNQNIEYESYRALWMHQMSHTPHFAYSCRICSNKFAFLYALTHHLRRFHVQRDGTVALRKTRTRSRRKRYL